MKAPTITTQLPAKQNAFSYLIEYIEELHTDGHIKLMLPDNLVLDMATLEENFVYHQLHESITGHVRLSGIMKHFDTFVHIYNTVFEETQRHMRGERTNLMPLLQLYDERMTLNKHTRFDYANPPRMIRQAWSYTH